MASRREPMKDAIISNCLPWFCCLPSINAVRLSPCFSMDSRLFLMETAFSIPASSVGTLLFVVRFLTFRHCLLGPARLTSPSEISLLVPLVPLEAMLLFYNATMLLEDLAFRSCLAVSHHDHLEGLRSEKTEKRCLSLLRPRVLWY